MDGIGTFCPIEKVSGRLKNKYFVQKPLFIGLYYQNQLLVKIYLQVKLVNLTLLLILVKYASIVTGC